MPGGTRPTAHAGAWHYIDNAGRMQGPFATECMASWTREGWFPGTTTVFSSGDLAAQRAGRPITAVPELWAAAGHAVHAEAGLNAASAGDSCAKEEALAEDLSTLSLDEGQGTATCGKKRVPAAVANKINALKGAQAGQRAWQSFQSKHSQGAGGSGTAVLDPTRAPVSFTLSGERGKASRSPTDARRSTSAAAAAGEKPQNARPDARRDGGEHCDHDGVLQCRKRLLFAVVDTNTWIDEALVLSSKRTEMTQEGAEGKDAMSQVSTSRESVRINKDAFLQGLATTEVKIVVPSQVVRELDGTLGSCRALAVCVRSDAVCVRTYACAACVQRHETLSQGRALMQRGARRGGLSATQI